MLFDDTYLTIAQPAEGIFRDRGSKFLGFAFPVKSTEEIAAHLEQLRKDHHSARHHCYAWRLGADHAAWRVNDDGEPSGTAGKPIYGQIQSSDLTNVVIIVVRYFGGTLLGVGGLINAYRAATHEAIANAQIIEKHITEIYRVEFPYDAMNTVMKILKDKDLPQTNQDFQLECKLDYSVRKSEADAVKEQLEKVSGVKLVWLRTE
jgi:uncharacterized YigZ family protein